MNTQEQTTRQSTPAAEVSQPAPTLSPEAAVEQLRTMRTQLGEVKPLTAGERRELRALARTSNTLVQASINVIGAREIISQAVGQPAEEVRQMVEESNRWTALEDELRVMLNAVSSANLVRRQRIAFVTKQAASIGAQLARDPAHADLVPQVQEIKRLKGFSRRKKKATPSGTPQTPQQPPASPAPGSTQSPPVGGTPTPKT